MCVWDLIGEIASIASCLAGIVAVWVAIYVHYDSKRPAIVAYLEHDRDHGCIYLVVSNQGNGIAYDVKITDFDYSLVESEHQEMARKSFLSRGIPVLVPNASRNTIIQAGAGMRECADKSGVIKLSYKEKGMLRKRHECTDEFVLDYYSFSGSIYVQSDLHEMKNAIKHIEKSLKELSSRVSSISNLYRQNLRNRSEGSSFLFRRTTKRIGEGKGWR